MLPRRSRAARALLIQAGGCRDSYASLSTEHSPHQGCFLMSAGKWATIREHLIRTLSSGSSGRRWPLAGWKPCMRQCCSLPGAREISRKLPWSECLDAVLLFPLTGENAPLILATFCFAVRRFAGVCSHCLCLS